MKQISKTTVVSGIALMAFAPASATPHHSSAGAASAQSIPALCREFGTAEQCTCYDSDVHSHLDGSQLGYLARYLRLHVGYKKRYGGAAQAYQKERPLANEFEGLTVGFSLMMARQQEVDRDNNALARDMGGAEPFYTMQKVHEAAVDRCEVGNTGPSRAERDAAAQQKADALAVRQKADADARQAALAAEAIARAGREKAAGEQLAREIPPGGKIGSTLERWAATYQFTPRFTQIIIDNAAQCYHAGKNIQWTPEVLAVARQPDADFRQLFWTAEHSQRRIPGAAPFSCNMEVSASQYSPQSNQMAGNQQILVWFIPVPLAVSDGYIVPIAATDESTPARIGLRVVLSVNPQFATPKFAEGVIWIPNE